MPRMKQQLYKLLSFLIKWKEKTIKEKDSMVLNKAFFHGKVSFGHCALLLGVSYAASSWALTATQIHLSHQAIPARDDFTSLHYGQLPCWSTAWDCYIA